MSENNQNKGKKDFKTWAKKRKWDIVFGVFVALIIFVPSFRMSVVSTVQRLLAFSPSELSESKQTTIKSFDWELYDLNGNIHNFSEAEGEVAVINLWATWCPPCVAEMPSLQKLYDHYGDRVKFYFVSNEKPETIQRFLTQKGYTFPVFIPATQYPDELNSNSLPTTFVLNKNKQIIMKEVGAHDWYSKKFLKRVDELLSE